MLKIFLFSTCLIFFSIFVEKNESIQISNIREIIRSPLSIIDFVKNKNAQIIQDKVDKCMEPFINSPITVFKHMKRGEIKFYFRFLKLIIVCVIKLGNQTCNRNEIYTFLYTLNDLMGLFTNSERIFIKIIPILNFLSL